MMKLTTFLLGAASALTMTTAVAPAMAAPILVNFAFTGTNGNAPGTVTGTLVFNTSGTGVAATNVFITGAPAGDLDAGAFNMDLLPGASIYRNAFTVSDAGIVSAADFGLTNYNPYRVAFELNDSYNGHGTQIYNYTTGDYSLSLGGFNATTYTPQAAAAVPEPAAWAMMILGMGAIGFAMRRQKVTTRVSYAA